MIGFRIGSALGAGLLAWLVGTGCVQVEESKNPVSEGLSEIGATVPPERRGRSEELSRIQFDDIPVPDGFFLRNHRNETYSFELGARRIGRFVYWGLGDEAKVARHYEDIMPRTPYGWTRSESTVSDGVRRLSFEKTGQRCVIDVEDLDRPGRNEVLITIFVESI